jgi:hypothetical protein
MSAASQPPAFVFTRARNGLTLQYVGDSLAMPIHWFYTPADIPAAFPPAGVTKLEAAPPTYPHSYLGLAPNDNIRVIGDIIAKGRRHLWGIEKQHPHLGLQAGEITLNADLARLSTRLIAANGGVFEASKYKSALTAFLTADPPQYRDLYIESHFVNMFQNEASGRPADKWTTYSDHIGCLAGVPVVAIGSLLHGRDVPHVQQLVREHLATFVKAEPYLLTAADDLVEVIDALLFRDQGVSAATVLEPFAHRRIAEKYPEWKSLLATPGIDVDAVLVDGVFKKHCPTPDSWPIILYLATKYPNDPATGLLVNANRGGDNVHRGIVLGALLGLGAEEGSELPFVKDLVAKAEIDSEIAALLTARKSEA